MMLTVKNHEDLASKRLGLGILTTAHLLTDHNNKRS